MIKIKYSLLACTILTFQLSLAQSSWMSTFESVNLDGADTFWNGRDGSGGIKNSNAYFINQYDSQWNFWSGFAVSSKTDIITPGYQNEFSAIAGSGVTFTKKYAVVSGSGKVMLQEPQVVSGCYITNNTYAAKSMKTGDQFAKKFGGSTGTDKDFFKLTATGFGKAGEQNTEIYLADYQYDNSINDYILSNWTYFDLSVLGVVDSIWFTLSSSDTGQWGMNTPAYFCMDDFNAPNPQYKNSFKVCDWKNYPLPTDSFENGSIADGGFLINGYFFANEFNSDWQSWSGFSVSSMRDTITADYTNEFSAMVQDDSLNTYLTGYNRASVYLPYDNKPFVVNSHASIVLKVANSTYAYRTMQSGNQFAKKFGGDNGTDPDFLVLKVSGLDYEGKALDTLTHFLADFRSTNPEDDYIQLGWEDLYLDLIFRQAVRLDFWIEGSDLGQFGLNTPAYFCIDDVFEFRQGGSTRSKTAINVTLYPNPAQTMLYVKSDKPISEYRVVNLSGQEILSGVYTYQIDVSSLNTGIYTLLLNSEGGYLRSIFVKQ